jgi:putative transcriptional regulator
MREPKRARSTATLAARSSNSGLPGQDKGNRKAAIHETMEALHDIGAIGKQTMRSFDDACLTPIRPLKPAEIRAIREKEQVSQTVFANYLNVTSSLVSKWERGEKRPSGASLKLLSLVEKNGLAAVA